MKIVMERNHLRKKGKPERESFCFAFSLGRNNYEEISSVSLDVIFNG